MRQWRRIGLVLALWLLVLGTAVQAHSELIGSEPAPGASLGTTPAVVTLRFDTPLTAGSTFILFDDAFRQVPGVAAGPTAADPTQMSAVPPALAPGQYTVQWVARSIDGDTTSGTFGFSITGSGGPAGGVAGGVPLVWFFALLGGVAFLAVLLVWQRQRSFQTY